jgi:hypothetical protein
MNYSPAKANGFPLFPLGLVSEFLSGGSLPDAEAKAVGVFCDDQDKSLKKRLNLR